MKYKYRLRKGLQAGAADLLAGRPCLGDRCDVRWPLSQEQPTLQPFPPPGVTGEQQGLLGEAGGLGPVLYLPPQLGKNLSTDVTSKARAAGPLSNSPDAKGHAAGSCQALSIYLPLSPSRFPSSVPRAPASLPPEPIAEKTLSSSATGAELQSVTRALGGATLPTAFRTLR